MVLYLLINLLMSRHLIMTWLGGFLCVRRPLLSDTRPRLPCLLAAIGPEGFRPGIPRLRRLARSPGRRSGPACHHEFFFSIISLNRSGSDDNITMNKLIVIVIDTTLYKWGECVCLLCATPILSDIQQTTADIQHTLSTILKHDHTPTSPNGQNNQQLKHRTPTTPIFNGFSVCVDV